MKSNLQIRKAISLIESITGKKVVLKESVEAPIFRKGKPKKSNKFDVVSLYYDGIYYFTSDIKPSAKREGKPFEIQGGYYDGKWMQDTFYISKDFKEFLLNAL